MNKFSYSITVFDGDINEVAVRLGECQHYSKRITDLMLSEAGIDINKDQLNFFQLLKNLKKRKDLVVSFYCVKGNNQFYIFSDFFNLDSAFSDTFSFFDDMNCVFMMCEMKDSLIQISLIKYGKVLFQFTVKIPSKNTVDDNEWRQSYTDVYDTVSGMPSIYDIEDSLSFILNTSRQSDNQMNNYLEKNALFKDKYII